MGGIPDPDRYLEHVLDDAEPGGQRKALVTPARRWTTWWTERTATDDPVVLAAARQGFVLASAELAALGVSRQRARTHVRRERWSAPARGVVAPIRVAEPDDDTFQVRRRRHALAAAAESLLRPDHLVSGRSAAILHGLPTMGVPDVPELTTAECARLGARGPVHIRSAATRIEEVTTWFGVPTMTVARTIVDLARHNRQDGLMAADAALYERLVDLGDIEFALSDCAGWPGIRQARDILASASPLAESALESITRLALADDGFPPPELQVAIAGTPYRVDFLWPRHRLILEADGREKYTAKELWREKRREARLRALGYRIERVLWEDVVRYWPATSLRLRAALAAR